MIGSSIVSSHEDGLDKLARHARVVLVILAAVQFGAVAFLYIAEPVTQWSGLGTMLGVGAAFAGLAAWARARPLPAVLTGLGIYLAGVILAALVEPATLTQGLTMKAIVAVMFYNGITAALTYNAMARVKPVAPAAPVEAPRTAPNRPLRLRQRRGATAPK